MKLLAKKFAAKKPTRKVLVSTLAPGLERLERAIAHQGLASRREAKALITTGSVSVNGKVIKEPGFGIKVDIDTIVIKGISEATKESVLFYKPRGLETSKTTPDSKDIKDKYKQFAHLSPVGRLDKESEGLILLTNDGTLTKAVTKEHSTVDKEYKVTVRENVTDESLQKMSTGILLDKIKTKPTTTKRISRYTFTIVLNEGRKHQIRRMCAACHLTVESLIRIRIGHLHSKGMKAGNSKLLNAEEVALLKQ
ncbi:pseudouridine synthase [Patescibacteria group bacterium]|nr:pseudouridine synthase [Patescibacteria group bacterium]